MAEANDHLDIFVVNSLRFGFSPWILELRGGRPGRKKQIHRIRGVLDSKHRSAAAQDSDVLEDADSEVETFPSTKDVASIARKEDHLEIDEWPDVDYDVEESPLVLLAACITRALDLAGQPGVDRNLLVEALRDLASAAVVDGADPARVLTMLPHLDAALDFGISATSRGGMTAAAVAAQRQRLFEALEAHVPGLFDGGPGLQARRGRITVALVVGWPGAGKTTLCARLAQNYQSRGIPCSVVCAPLPPGHHAIADADRRLVECVRAGGGVVYAGMEGEGCRAGEDDPVQFARRGVKAVQEQAAQTGPGSMAGEGGVILVDTASAWPGPASVGDSGCGQSTMVVGAAKQLVGGLRPDHVLLVIDASAGPAVARQQVRAMLSTFSRSTMSVACVRLKESNSGNCSGIVGEAQDGSEETLDVGGGRGSWGAAVLGALAASRCTVSVAVVGDTADDVGGFDAHRFLTALLLDSLPPLPPSNETRTGAEHAPARAARRRGRKTASAVQRAGAGGGPGGEWAGSVAETTAPAPAEATAVKDKKQHSKGQGMARGEQLGKGKEKEQKRDFRAGPAMTGQGQHSRAGSLKATLRRAGATTVRVEVLRPDADSEALLRGRRLRFAGRGWRADGWVGRDKAVLGDAATASVQAVLGEAGARDLEGMAGDLAAQGVPPHVLSELIQLARQFPPGSLGAPVPHLDRGPATATMRARRSDKR